MALRKEIKKKSKKDYRENVAAVIINKDKKILMCEHVWIKGSWQMPQGGVEFNETEEEAILRELEEEIGTNKLIILDKMDKKLKYEFPYYLKAKYDFSGQIQRYFLVYFYGDDREIRFDNQPKPEFRSFEWVDLDEPPKRVIYFKKISYLKAIEYFKEKIKNLDLSKVDLNNRIQLNKF
jgi:putative (di)nucleoside polyphosphate hydrolase